MTNQSLRDGAMRTDELSKERMKGSNAVVSLELGAEPQAMVIYILILKKQKRHMVCSRKSQQSSDFICTPLVLSISPDLT